MAVIAFVLALALLISSHALLPFERVVTIEGLIASKSEYFNDPEVKRLLLRHNMRVHLTIRGSIEIADAELAGQDFAFPSGQPAADVILDRLRSEGRSTSTYKPFTTPVALATFRQHADALIQADVATPTPGPDGGEPYFYKRDMEGFLGMVEDKTRWRKYGPPSDNRITVYTPSICRANSAVTYMALVAFVRNKYEVPQDATAIAKEIKPLLDISGQTSEDLLIFYKTPEGKGKPMVAIYESEFLAYQLEHRARTGSLDRERVLMYPSVDTTTEPALIPLTPTGERLGQLLTSDPRLRRRATELGFRLTSRGSEPTGDALTGYVREKGLPMPTVGQDGGTALVYPKQDPLKEMIRVTGDCRP